MANTALGDIKVHKKTNKLKRVFLGRGDHCCLACVFWCWYIVQRLFNLLCYVIW